MTACQIITRHLIFGDFAMLSRGPMMIIAAICLIAGPIIMTKLDPSLLGGDGASTETATNAFSDIPARIPAQSAADKTAAPTPAAAPTAERRTMSGGGAVFVTARQ